MLRKHNKSIVPTAKILQLMTPFPVSAALTTVEISKSLPCVKGGGTQSVTEGL